MPQIILSKQTVREVRCEADAVMARAAELAIPGLALLEQLVAINSHAENPAGVRRCLDLVSAKLGPLGFETRIVETPPAGPAASGEPPLTHLVARRGSSSLIPAPRVALIGHIDTVFPSNHGFTTLEKKPGVWIGPGVSDMKGGVVTIILALELLDRLNALDGLELCVVLVGDEETGSAAGRDVLLEAVRGSEIALSFEAARPGGELVIGRKGMGTSRVLVRGRSGHAGIDHAVAVNALTVMAKLLVAAEGLEERFPGVTISPGGRVLVRPEILNAVPDSAQCELEWRFDDPLHGELVPRLLGHLAAEIGAGCGATVTIACELEAPPMQATEQSRQMLSVYQSAAMELGLRLEAVETAGVSDINLVAGEGLVCLDGLGPLGGSFHTTDEYLNVDTVAQRASLSALVLARLAVQGGAPLP